MEEARSLQYSIDIAANVDKAEQDIQSLISQCGRLREEAVDIRVDADTDHAAESIQEIVGDIGGIESVDIDIKADAGESEKYIRELAGDIGDLTVTADSIGSAFRKSFLTGVDSGNSLASAIRSGVGGALTYTSDAVTDFKGNFVSGAKSIGHGFAHPIETIKTGLGGAVDRAKSKFVDFIRGADDAADAADDVGGAAAGAKPDVEGLGDAAEKSGGKFEKLGGILKGIGKVAATGLAAATVAVGGFAASSVNTGMAFDSSMSQVAATMGYSTAELNDSTSEASKNFSKLREFAMEMGATTAFSASQSADALNYMALAGYDAETSMNMLPNVLNLAAAGGIELAAASDMVTNAQSALGLSLDETSELVDKMAAASSKSNTSVQQLGDAILAIGGTAKDLAGGTTELSTALGILADNGIQGAEGGTHLRNIILSLGSPTDTAAKALKQLGVDVFDAEGKMRPLNETFGDLNDALSTMSQGDRMSAISDIFNTTDVASVNALLGTSAERWDELGSAVDGAWVNMGSLSESMSDVGLDLKATQDSLDRLGISGETFSDILKTSGGDAEAFADGLWEAADAGVSQADIIGALGGNLKDLQAAFDSTTGAAQAMADTQLDNLAGDITYFKSALEAAQIIISDELSPTLREFTQFGTESVTKLSEAFKKDGLTGAMGALGEILSDGLGMIVEMLPSVVDAGMQLLGALGQGLLDNMPLIIDAAIRIVSTLGNGILKSLPVLVGAAMQIIASLASGIGEMLSELIPAIVETVILIAETLIENLPLILDAGMQLLSGLTDGIIGALPLLIEKLPQLIISFVGFITENLPQLVETGINLIVQLGVGLIQAIPSLVAQLPQIIAAIVGGFAEVPGMMLDIGGNIVKGIWEGITAMGSWLKEKVSGFFGGVVDGIKGLLGIHSPSTVFEEIGDNMALGFGKGFGESMKTVAEDIEDEIPTDFSGPETDDPDPDKTGPVPEDGGGDWGPGPGGTGPAGAAFAPEVKIEITVQGIADEESLDELRLRLMDEFTAKMRELFAEFREEELQRAALKNQYAF